MIGELLSEGWNRYKEHWGTYVGLVLLTWVVLVVAGIVAVGPMLPAMMAGDPSAIMSVMGTSIALLLVVGLVVFVVMEWIDSAILIAANTGASFGEALGQAKEVLVNRIVADLLAGIAIWVPTVLILVVTGGAAMFSGEQANAGLAMFGIALALIVAAYLGIRLFWTSYNAAIRKRGAVESVTAAWADTGHDIWAPVYTIIALIVLAIIDWVLSIIPVIGFLIGALVVKPIGRIVYTVAGEKVLK